MGICLHRIKDIRLLYDEEAFGISPIDFDEPRVKPQAHGHAIAARITSENPNEVTNDMREEPMDVGLVNSSRDSNRARAPWKN